MLQRILTVKIVALIGCQLAASVAFGDDVLPTLEKRFTLQDGKITEEVPDLQRHVIPLLGRLGCNSRSCHGSFQGQGGFQLSLFGYDFQADHKAMTGGDEPRADKNNPLESLVLQKPSADDEFTHGGGQRFKKDGWQYQVIRAWIANGTEDKPVPDKLDALKIEPAEIVFGKKDEKVQLQVIAVWADGSQEDVTPLCRFQTNDSQIADINDDGLVTSGTSGDTHVVVFYDKAVVPVPIMKPVSDKIGKKYPEVATPTKIDELVVQKLRKIGVVPSELSDDAEFLRRVSLDLTGSLPTAKEVKDFLANESPSKRSEKINELLERPTYAAWWTTKLCDFTGNNNAQLNNVGPIRNEASKEWYDWIYKRVEENSPYDELAAGIIVAKSRGEDQSYIEYCEEMSELYHPKSEESFADLPSMTHYWARRDFREVEARAIAVAYSFMGLRIQCAQCHKHPFDQWSKDDFAKFAAIFEPVNFAARPREKDSGYEELVAKLKLKDKKGNDLRRALPDLLKDGETVPFPELVVTPPNQNRRRNNEYVADTAKLLGGPVIEGVADPREALMDWLREKDNPYFARAFVNRVWAAYFNVGIVEPPDDLSLANPPSNAALLDYLTAEFIAHDFDMKWLHREILNSATYQRTWQTNETNELDLKNFSHSVPRRMPAEVVVDAIRQATADDATGEKMQTSTSGRTIAIASATSRNGNGGNFALELFGVSKRETNCECDRSSDPNLLQTVFLRNDAEVLRSLDARDGWLSSQGLKAGATAVPAAQNADPKIEARIKQARTQKAALKERITKLEAAGEKDRADQLRRQIAKINERLADVGATADDKEEVAEGEATPAEDENKRADATAELIREAYLRVLSRMPSDEELARCQQHVESADNVSVGMRDIMWALINTKEFIVIR